MQIGFVTHHPGSPYWAMIINAARETATELGMTLIIEPTETIAQQVTAFERLLARRVDAIIIGPHGEAGMADQVAQAQASGVPVIVTDNRLVGCRPDSTVMTRNSNGGEIIATHVIEQLGEHGTVILISGPSRFVSATERAAGARSVLQRHATVQLIAEYESTGWEREVGIALGRRILAEHPNVDAIIAPNDLVGFGITAAFAVSAHTPLVTGFDAGPDALVAIHQGVLSASVQQPMRELGRIPVELAAQRLRGQSIPTDVQVNVRLVTPANLTSTLLDTVFAMPGMISGAIESAIALETERTRLLTLIDNLPETYVFIKDVDGRYVVASEEYARLINYDSRDTLIGRHDRDLATAAMNGDHTADDAQVIDSGRVVLDRVDEFFDQHGQQHWMLTSKMPLRNITGHITGLIGVVRDITTLKHQEQERAALAEAVISAQAAALRELSTPIIPITDRIVIVPLIGAIDQNRASSLIETLLEGVSRLGADLVIVDITGVPVVDTNVANSIIRAAQAVKLLGAQIMLTGIRPEVAQTLVSLGADLNTIRTQATLQSAVAQALRGS